MKWLRGTPTVLAAQVWGTLCGAILGAHQTREAALRLLDKNQALQTAGIPALPGPGHWNTMAGWGPAFAGALFFGLSLGLGWGTMLGVWAWASRTVPGPLGRWTPWVGLAAPLWAFAAGDPVLGAALLVAAVGAVSVAFGFEAPSSRALFWQLVLVAIVAVGLIPWAHATEGAFTRLRDRYLITNPLGLALNDYYYRWTLYPAEVLKPLAAKSQPAAGIPGDLAPERYRSFCDEALRQRILCLPPGSPGADFRVVPTQQGLVLSGAGGPSAWPRRDPEHQETTWLNFSRATDSALALRKATAVALFVGCPLGLCWGLAALGRRFSAGLPGSKSRMVGSAACAGLITGLLWITSVPSPDLAGAREQLLGRAAPDLEVVETYLGSPRPAERFYAARVAGGLGPAALPLLIEGLTDPIINVRYAAAQSLGQVGGERARAVLLEVLRSPEEWYVKERAYAALWRAGWRPP